MSKIKNPAAIAAVQKEVEGLKSQIIGMGDKLWTIAELSLQEEESAAYLIGELQDNDFNIDSVGTSNIPTAFTASYGSGSPVIGIMTEYDALPDLRSDWGQMKNSGLIGVTDWGQMKNSRTYLLH